jgi:hypothetical protein
VVVEFNGAILPRQRWRRAAGTGSRCVSRWSPLSGAVPYFHASTGLEAALRSVSCPTCCVGC